MAHETVYSANANGYLRAVRSFLMNAPRVVRANDHDDINNLGIDYTLAASGARPAGDILHVAPELGCPQSTYRATCVVGTAVGGSFQTNINDTVTWNSAARTITSDGLTDFSAAGVVAGDLIRISNAATASNNQVYRVLSITGGSNHIITLNTLDVVTNNDAADAIDIRPITGGSIFDVREDQPGGNNHIGWMTDEVEFMAKDGTIWLFMRSGGSWAVNDYAEWDLEAGHFTLYDEWAVLRTVSLNENGAGADTITRTDYNGNFLRDGFESGGLVEISGSAGEDGVYTIVTAAAQTLTLNIGDFTADELDVEVTLTPRQTVTVDFDDADAGFGNDPTIIRSSGSWVDEGYFPGGQIEISDAVDAGNNGTFLIASIDTDTTTDDTLVLDSAEVIADETADVITATPRNHILLAWDEHRYIWGSTSGSPSNSNTLDSGELPPIPDADGNYTSEWVAIAPGDDPVNNLQTIYVGWQTQFSGASIQNVEMRGFDAVSDSSFGSLGNASLPVYIYLTLDPSMETFMVADGAHCTGFMDVNTSVTEWWYLGFAAIHGTQNQHPRPLVVGGAGLDPSGSRVGSGARYQFFPAGVTKDSTTIAGLDPIEASCWHRWVDGQWFGVAANHLDSNDVNDGNTNANCEMYHWPWINAATTTSYPTHQFNNQSEALQREIGSGNSNPIGRSIFFEGMRATPTTITPNPNREYVLFPVVGVMFNPDDNVVYDLRNVYWIPGDGQATKNRILQGGFTHIVGQNHEKTGQMDFAALRMK